MKHLLAAVLVIAVSAVALQASTIITPVAAGTCNGSMWVGLNQDFDNQPTWDGTQPVSTTISGSNTAAYAGRWGFIDFGPDFANIRIEQTWTRYRNWSGGDVTTWVGGFWTTTDPSVAPSQIPAAITETRILFESQTNLASTGGTTPWIRDADMTASPVTPLGRYLCLNVKTPDPQGRGQEYAIVGYVVPEPATMCLLAFGGLALLRRR